MKLYEVHTKSSHSRDCHSAEGDHEIAVFTESQYVQAKSMFDYEVAGDPGDTYCVHTYIVIVDDADHDNELERYLHDERHGVCS